ncbi:MAG: hypothetical protein ABL958_00545 [Bdellovibrionia bacterium]
MKKLLVLSVLVLPMLACSGSGSSGGGSGTLSAGNARKVDMNSGSRVLRALFLTGDQVNIGVQRGKSGSTFLVYSCDVSGYTTSPALSIQTASLDINFYNANQVNCGLALPDSAPLEIENATQANVNMALSTGNVTITNVGQANATFAVPQGGLYRFSVTAPQVNNMASCAAYSTNSQSAPLIRIQASTQANITCVSASSIPWLRVELSEPDSVTIKVNDGKL